MENYSYKKVSRKMSSFAKRCIYKMHKFYEKIARPRNTQYGKAIMVNGQKGEERGKSNKRRKERGEGRDRRGRGEEYKGKE